VTWSATAAEQRIPVHSALFYHPETHADRLVQLYEYGPTALQSIQLYSRVRTAVQIFRVKKSVATHASHRAPPRGGAAARAAAARPSRTRRTARAARRACTAFVGASFQLERTTRRGSLTVRGSHQRFSTKEDTLCSGSSGLSALVPC
jgi:hypothetical protein